MHIEKERFDRLILIDGVCKTCHWLVQLLYSADNKKIHRVAMQQSSIGKEIIALYELQNVVQDSIILIYKQRAFLRSDAIIMITADLSYPWKIISWLKFVPTFFRDLGYRFIAKNRYKIMGRYQKCLIPDARIKSIFLEEM